jgi:L-ascorbate oxidase
LLHKSAGQRADGLYGAFVIRDTTDVNSKEYDHDLPEHVIVVNDWMHKTMIPKYTDFLHTNGDETIDGILINGRGVDVKIEPATKKPRLNYETPRSVFRVTHGHRYRFRMINSGVQYCPLHVSVDNHTLTLIATDGNFKMHKKYSLTSFE